MAARDAADSRTTRRVPVKNPRLYPLIVAAMLAGAMVACESSTDVGLLSDATITADVASSSGDAVAVAVATMIANQSTGGLSSVEAPPDAVMASVVDNSGVIFNRSRTCLDANGATVNNCAPLSSVRQIITHVTLDGTRTGANDDETRSWAGAVHRVADDTLTRVFVSANETSRIHVGTATGNDTTTFTEGTFVRNAVETAIDSTKAVTFNLPRSQNPWPVSGSIVRRVHVKVTITRGGNTDTREMDLRVEVIFPADAQGNVVLHINNRTCNLNLVTHAVTACT